MRRCVLAAALVAGCGAAAVGHAELRGARSVLVRDSVFGGKMLVREAGPPGAPAMVLVHGLGQRASRDWDPVLPALAARYRVIAIDLPGFGRSSRGNRAYTPARYVEALDRVLRARVRAPFILVGHSMGGAISLLYAARHADRVSKLALIDVAGILHRDAYMSFIADARAGGAVASIATTVTSPFAHRLPPPEVLLASAVARETFLGGDPGRIAALALLVYDFGAAMDAVRAPTRILWGARDDVAALRVARVLEARIPGTRLEVRRGVGHVPMTDAPAWVAARLLAFAGEAPQAIVPARIAQAADRVGRCAGRREPQRFEGSFDRIEIRGCRDVVLDRVIARRVVASDSVVTLDRVRLVARDGAPALDLDESVARVTAGRVEGSVCVRLAGSVLDAAGTVFRCAEASFAATSDSKLILSVTRVEGPRGTRRLHEVRGLEEGQRL